MDEPDVLSRMIPYSRGCCEILFIQPFFWPSVYFPAQFCFTSVCSSTSMCFSFFAVSPLPVIKNAAESERVAADSRTDRMTIWMRNVESMCSVEIFVGPC